MNTIKILTISTILTLCLFISGYCAESKIAVVDFQEILEKSKVGKAAKQEYIKRGEKIEKELKAKAEEIEKLKKKLEREALVIDRETKLERERELRIKINDYKALQKKSISEIGEIEARMISRIRDQLVGIVEQIGKDEGFSLILEKIQAGVLYCPERIDITDKVIKKYNATVKK